MKTCAACGKSKAIDDFPRDKRSRDGHGARCLMCKRQYREHQGENAESGTGDLVRETSNPGPKEELGAVRPQRDEYEVVEPQIARWRAELEARRRAGIPDQDIDLREPVKKARPRVRLRFKPFAIIALVVMIALLIDLVYVGFGLRSHLSSVSSSLSQGRQAIADADLQGARRSFAAGLKAARDADGLTSHPASRIAQAMPWISSDASAVSLPIGEWP